MMNKFKWSMRLTAVPRALLMVLFFVSSCTISDLQPILDDDPVTTTDPNAPLVGFENGRLVYRVDSLGNRVPDFSGVGYMNSEMPIPDVVAVDTIYPYNGSDNDWDDSERIQAAIDGLSILPLSGGSRPTRGALYFVPGEYRLRESVIINTDGIVLRGAGTGEYGTRLIATAPRQYDLIRFVGQGVSQHPMLPIADTYLSIGADEVTMDDIGALQVGDWVYLRRRPNNDWIAGIGMDEMGWTASSFATIYEREIKKISPHGTGQYLVKLDAPSMDIIDSQYANGHLWPIASDNRIRHCGIEYMQLESVYASETDENHAWKAIVFANVAHGWARGIDAYYFGRGAVDITRYTSWITVDNCRMIDAKSELRGSRRYSFHITGQRNLVMNCYARQGRHDYVTDARTSGPNVFLNCIAEEQESDIGPHHRWATGTLYERIIGNREINVRNRTVSGWSSSSPSGHGWAGAQHMIWRCEANRIRVQRPPLGHINWAVESTNVTGRGSGSDWSPDEPIGEVQAVAPVESLFEQQLQERKRRLGLLSGLN